MRSMTILAAGLAGVLLAGSAALAQEAPAGGAGPRAGARDPLARLEGLGLTEEQKTKAKAIFDAAREKVKGSTDRAALRQAMQGAMEQVRKDVLTEEQRKKLDAMPRGGRRDPLAMLERLGLTDEQKAKVKTISDGAREKAQQAKTPEARAEIWKAAMDEVAKSVLTEEQRKKLEAMPRPGELPGVERLNLTDEQKAKIKDILVAARANAQKAEGAEAKAAVWKAAQEDVAKNVLTEEQRKTLEQNRTAMEAAGERMIQRRLEALGLTDAQKGKAKEILDAAKAKAEKAEGAQAKMEIWRAAGDDIKKNVLTEEQRTKWDASRPAGRGGRGGAGGPGASGGAAPK